MAKTRFLRGSKFFCWYFCWYFSKTSKIIINKNSNLALYCGFRPTHHIRIQAIQYHTRKPVVSLLSLHLNKYPYIMLCMFIMNVKEKTKLHLTESLQRRFKAIQHIVIFNHNALKIQKLKIQKTRVFYVISLLLIC